MTDRTKIAVQSEGIRRTPTGTSGVPRTFGVLGVFFIALVLYVAVVIHSNAQQVELAALVERLATVSTEKNTQEVQIATLLGATAHPLLADMIPTDRGVEYFPITPADLARK